jgi:hypothetical protein
MDLSKTTFTTSKDNENWSQYTNLECLIHAPGRLNPKEFNSWATYKEWMDTSRTAKRILVWKPMGSRPLGRPRLRWLDDVCDGLKVMTVKNWKESLEWLVWESQNPQKVVVLMEEEKHKYALHFLRSDI